MATVLYGAIVDKMRGSIRGTTFSSAGGVEVAKGRGRPPRPSTALQQVARSLMGRFAPAWRNLTSTVKTDWKNFAATYSFVNSLGQTYYIGGFQMYVMSSAFLSLRGPVTTAAPPTANGHPTVSIPTLAYSGGDIRITAFAPAFPGGMTMRGSVYVPAIASWNNPRAPIFTQFEYTGAGLPIAIAQDIDAAFASGSILRTFVRWRQMDTNGRLSIMNQGQVDWTKA